jgi:copper chaperone CopZ
MPEMTGSPAAINNIELQIAGMTCASCAARIENKLNSLDGVNATVNYATEKATVTVPPAYDPQALIAEVEKTGYAAALPQQHEAPVPGAEPDTPELRSLRHRLIAAVVLATPVIAMAMVPALQFRYWQWASLALAAPVVVWAGRSFHAAAWANLTHGVATMDTLVSVGTLSAFVWSLYALFLETAGQPGMRHSFELTVTPSDGAANSYLEVAAGVTLFVLAGRYFEKRSKRRAGAALRAMLELGAKDVAVLSADIRRTCFGPLATTWPRSRSPRWACSTRCWPAPRWHSPVCSSSAIACACAPSRAPLGRTTHPLGPRRPDMNAPDPQRLGGLAWARRTGGRLSRAERRRLVAATALGQWENAVGRAKLAIGRLPAAAAHVDLDTFLVPDSKFAREAEQACAELPAALQGHSYRTWLFGRALARVDDNKLDDELFYCGALLHDYGIANPTAERDFTLGSVDRMRSAANAAGVPADRADSLADSICVHTTPGIKVETDGATGCYLQWGAMVDGAGLRIWDVSPGNVQGVLRRYPRGDFKHQLVEMIRAEAAAVPGGRMKLLVRCGLPLAVRMAPFDS